MASAFEMAGYAGAEQVRGAFGMAATDISSLKPGVVAGIKQSLSISNGMDAAPTLGMHI